MESSALSAIKHAVGVRTWAPAFGIVAVLIGGYCRDVCAKSVPKADLYVAVDGNDAWSGTLPAANADKTDGPFATPHRARDAVRRLKTRGGHDGPFTVLVRGGTYYLSEPLVLGPDDSGTADCPVIYAAYPGEQVTLSGGRPITRWWPDEYVLWTADVPDLAPSTAQADPDAGKRRWVFRQLFVGDERQTLARTPNFDPEHPRTGGWSFVVPFVEKVEPKGRFGDTLVRIHTSGDTFAWKVDVPADGDYALWLYYGAKNEPHGRKTMAGRTTMQVDDAKPVRLQNLPDTGGWGIFQWRKTATLRLAKGQHRLRWTNVKGGGLNFDAFVLANQPDWTPKGTKLTGADPAAGKHVILVQAEAFESGKGKEFGVAKGRSSHHRDKFVFRPGDLARWPRSPEPEIHIFPAWGWVNAILSVARIDHASHVVHVKNRNCSQELRPGNRYYVANVFEAIDTPGEWFLDRTNGRIYLWPKVADFERRDVVAPLLDRIIDLVGEDPGERPGQIKAAKKPDAARKRDRKAEPRAVEHIVIRGFTFRHTTYSLEIGSVYSPDDGAVWMRRARHCVIENCKFLGIGGYAVRMSDHASDNAILGNTVADAGQGGVLMIGYDTASQPKDNLVAGNHIHHCGRIWKHVAGIYVTTGGGNRIAHNTVTDVPRYGISLKTFGKDRASHNNIIEYNRILRTNLETNDTGAIETLGRDREDTGNVIRYNLILDAVGLKTSPTGEMLTPFYSWGIYLDDYSSGTKVTGNIVARNVRGGLHVHLGRNNTFQNNIFVDAQNQQSEYNGGDFMANNTFVRNIVYYHTGKLLRFNRYHDKVLTECDRNVYWCVGGDLTQASGDVTPRGPWAKWREAGYDANSIVADPRFVDPAHDDYRLRPDSPALELGFKPIDATKIGVQGYRRPPGVP